MLSSKVTLFGDIFVKFHYYLRDVECEINLYLRTLLAFGNAYKLGFDEIPIAGFKNNKGLTEHLVCSASAR